MLTYQGDVGGLEKQITDYIAPRFANRDELERKLLEAGFKPLGKVENCDFFRYDEETVQFKPVLFVGVSLCETDWRVTTALTFL